MDNSFLPYYLITSALLFSIGLAVVLTKRNVIVVLMGIELMLNAVNLNLIAFSKNDPNLQGQMFALFVIVVAVCESVVALAIILKAFEHFKTVNLDEISEVREIAPSAPRGGTKIGLGNSPSGAVRRFD